MSKQELKRGDRKTEIRFSFRGLDIECDVVREQDTRTTPGSCIVVGIGASVEDRSMFESCLPEKLTRKLDRGEAVEIVIEDAIDEWLEEIEEKAAEGTR